MEKIWPDGLAERIGDTLRAEVDCGGVAGANVLLWKDGGELYCQEGMADIAGGVPIRRDTIFRLYSMTKPVTGAAVMLLLERGAIDLMDPVSRYLPGFRDQRVAEGDKLVPVRREMNLADLLAMTSGLPYGDTQTLAGRETSDVFEAAARRLETDHPMGTVEMANQLGQCPLAFHPGERWMYGTSADVLGSVVEVVSRKSFGQFLRDEIFAPLGMEDTAFYVPADKQPRLSKVYQQTGQGLEEYGQHHLGIFNPLSKPPACEAGGAGLASTADDMMRFTRMLLGGGQLEGTRILSPKTVEFFTAPQLTPRQREGMADWTNISGYSYGKLMRVLTDPGQAVLLGSPGEYGWDGWLGAYFANLPRENASLILMMQLTDAGTPSLTRRVRNLALASL